MGRGMRLGLLAGGVLLLAGFLFYNYLFRKHTTVKGNADISITAPKLFSAYSHDEQAANAHYLNKIIEVTGKVTALQKNQDGHSVLILDGNDPLFGISCTLENESTRLHAPEDTITLKGICRGFLSDVVLTDCIVVDNRNE